VLFNELVFTSRLYMRELTHASLDWLAELAPHYFAAAAEGGGAAPKMHPMRFHGGGGGGSSFR